MLETTTEVSHSTKEKNKKIEGNGEISLATLTSTTGSIENLEEKKLKHDADSVSC